MSEQQVRDVMMRYLDGEASPEEAASFEAKLDSSTELKRELAMYKALKDDLATLGLRGLGATSVWDKVNRHVARPTAWILIIVGTAAWVLYGAYLFIASDTNVWEKLATSAVVIGTLILLATIGWESYKSWQIDPYKDVQR